MKSNIPKTATVYNFTTEQSSKEENDIMWKRHEKT